MNFSETQFWTYVRSYDNLNLTNVSETPQELDSDNLYDADTEDIVQDNVLKRKLIKSKNNRFSTSRRDDNGQFQKLHLKNSGIMDKKSQVSEES